MKCCLALAILVLPLAGCIETHVVVDQPKPLQININFSGHLDLVIHDAREDLEKITGEKPANVVRPEDIGLPAANSGTAAPVDPRNLGGSPTSEIPVWFPVSLRTSHQAPASETYVPVALKDDLQAAMAARSAQIRALWDAKAVGESHSGLLVVKGTLTAEEQKLVNAENADRTSLYADEAKTKKETTDTVATAYYLARLGYAKKGAWYEVRNAAGQWEWKQWGT